jgi:serine protease Do
VSSDSSLQRLSLWIIAASLTVIVAYYGLPEIIHRVTVAVERGRADAADVQLQKLGDSSEVFRLVAKRVAPAVVNVSNLAVVSRPTFRLGPSGGLMLEREQGLWPQGQGSGFVIDPRGYVVTNRHVVKGARQVRVSFAHGAERGARIIGTDEHTDLAVLQVQMDGLVSAEFGDSDQVEVGDWVLAIGNPFGLEQSVTAGIVSAKGRSSIVEKLDVQDFLQTDAAINPGNSGGPLVDLKGRIIGVNSAIWSKSGGYEGIGFAIPSKIAKSVVDQLIATGKVTRSWLGVSSATGTGAGRGASASASGIVVSEVFPNSPADKAGLQVGDLIQSIDGRRLEAFEELRSKVLRSRAGTKLRLEVERGGDRREVTAVIEEQPAGLAWFEDQFGISVADMTAELALRYRLPRDHGVLITDVVSGLAADREGLRAGDIIVSVNKRDVRNVSQLLGSLQQVDMSKGVLMGVISPNGNQRLVVLGD